MSSIVKAFLVSLDLLRWWSEPRDAYLFEAAVTTIQDLEDAEILLSHPELVGIVRMIAEQAVVRPEEGT